jgi:signal transduction histidine kinase
MPKRTDREFLHFSVASALLRELGERLVGKPQVALAELVKNGYDADAHHILIRIDDDSIEVLDDGDGMTRKQFSDFWMSIGTTHKLRSPLSPRLKRQVTGSKGIGRLSAQFLGNKLTLWSRPRSMPSTGIKVDVDWREAQEAGDIVRSGAWVESSSPDGILPTGWECGTRIRIEGLNQEWDQQTLKLLARELWFLRPPQPTRTKLPPRERFDIQLEGTASELIDAFSSQMDAAFSNWIAEIKGHIEDGHNIGSKAHVSVRFRDGEIFSETFPLDHKKLHNASFKIRVFNLAGRQQGGIEVKEAREYFRRYGGVHIYDEGFRLPFYGGDHDWLNLERDHSHRLITSKLLPDQLQIEGDLRDLPTNGRIFGTVTVSTADERKNAPKKDRDRGDYLNIQLTRDRLIENDALADLVQLVRWGIDYYAIKQSSRRQREAAANVREVPPAEPVLDELRQRVSELRSEGLATPAVRKVAKIESKLDELVEIERQRKQILADERVLLGALATAGMGAVALEHELGKEVTALRDMVGRMEAIKPSDPKILEIINALKTWIERSTATRKLFSPLMNVEDRENRAEFRARKIVDLVIRNSSPLLRGVSVEADLIPNDLKFPMGTMSAWQAIFQNVFVNSVNALIDAGSKRILCSAGEDGSGMCYILVEDNGAGIDLADSEDLFKPFVRRMEISQERRALGLGGVGLGLTIVRMVAESLGCYVAFVKPSPGMSSAFKLSWKANNATKGISHTHHRR